MDFVVFQVFTLLAICRCSRPVPRHHVHLEYIPQIRF